MKVSKIECVEIEMGEAVIVRCGEVSLTLSSFISKAGKNLIAVEGFHVCGNMPQKIITTAEKQ